MEHGTVIWFNPRKGYGFISVDDGGKGFDAFVHFSQIQMDGYRTLEEDEQVVFDLVQTPKGVQAQNVHRNS